MHVTVETTGNLGRRMTVAVPAARMEQEIAARLKRLSQLINDSARGRSIAPLTTTK